MDKTLKYPTHIDRNSSTALLQRHSAAIGGRGLLSALVLGCTFLAIGCEEPKPARMTPPANPVAPPPLDAKPTKIGQGLNSTQDAAAPTK